MILSWFYIPDEKGAKWVEIGSKVEPPPRDPRIKAVLLGQIATDDPEEAEEWRLALTKGEIPSHDSAASMRVLLRWLHRERGMSIEALAFRHQMDVAAMRSLIE